MDSMRSLNTSLPSSTSNPASSQPPEQLLQAFKTAALSVTNLYKTSVSDQSNARHLGYQEALEDLRTFLDREKLGTEDGEAAKIRSWVVDRLDGTGTTTTGDSDDERGDAPSDTTRKENPETNQQPRQQSPNQPPSATAAAATPDESNTSSRPPTFTFTAGPQLPSSHPEDTDMQPSDSGALSSESTHVPPTSSHTSPSVRLEVIPRGPRTTHRTNSGIRSGPRQSTRESPANAGSKRKFHFPDFFDISSFGNGRDSFGGGKRGRFT